MIEFNLASPESSPAALPVAVIGVGGAGTNVLDTIALEGFPDARLVALNTDVRALQNAMTGTCLQLGKDLTRGLGAGGDPEVGMAAAAASEEEIREAVRGQQMVFICVGLGGGTGSGAAPAIVRAAREEGAFVVVFAIMPFGFEGRRRLRQAREALESLRSESSALITFDNDRLGELVLPKKGIHEAFAAADRVVSQSIRAIIHLVTQPGLIRIGMDDLIAALRHEDSRCLFGFGVAGGENRALAALAAALKSPLLQRGDRLRKAHRVLVHVCGGPEMTFFEVQELMEKLGRHLHEDAHILFGTGLDAKLGDQMSVTIFTSEGNASLDEAADGSGEAPVAAEEAAPAAADSTDAWTGAQTVEGATEAAVAANAEVTDDADSPETDAEVWDAADSPEATEAEIAASDDEEPVTGEYSGAIEAVDEVPEDPIAAEASADSSGSEAGDEIEREGEPQFDAPSTPVPPEAAPVPTAGSRRGFALKNLVSSRGPAGQPGPGGRPASGKPVFFQSWRREQERLKALPPQPPEQVPPVSDLGDLPEPEAPAPPQPRRVERRQHHPRSLFGLNNPAAKPAAEEEDSSEQATFDESLHPASRGRFDNSQPTIEGGQDLDVPTFLRRREK